MHRITKQTFVFFLALAGLGGCVSGPKPFVIKGDGAPVLNRDINGKSLSVVVRIFQLKSTNEFAKLTFDTLTDGRPEAELLGAELLAKTDAIIVPGESFSSSDKLLEDTKFVGVVAYFRNPDPHYWRYLVEADEVRSNGLSFKVEDCFIAIKGINPLPIPGQPKNARPQCQTTNFAPQRTGSQAAQPANRVAPQANSRQAQSGQPAAKKSSWMPDVNVNLGGGGAPAPAPAAAPAPAPASGGGGINVNVGSGAPGRAGW